MLAFGLAVVAAVFAADEIPTTPAKLRVLAVQGLHEASDAAPTQRTPTAEPLRPPATTLAPAPNAADRRTERFGPGLEEVRRALQGLDYQAFRRINRVEKSIAYRTEARIELDARYTLCVSPMSRDDQGRVKLNVRVEMKPRQPGGAPINVVSNTTLALVPGKQANVGGMRLEKGELIVVIWVPE